MSITKSNDPKRPKPTTLHTRNMPPHLKAQFKAWCARRGYTMEDVVICCIRRVLTEDKPIKDARKPKRVGS